MRQIFIIGAQRSGTTYLYNILNAHPKICMAKPVRPEPKHFLNQSEYDKGVEYYESLYYKEYNSMQIYIGEKSTSYLEFSFVAQRINAYYPDAKIIVILRNPVERAYSNYKFSCENGLESLSFVDALRAEKKRLSDCRFQISVNPYAYVQRGHYIQYLLGYDKVFSESQIKIIIHEEFVSNNAAILDLYSWLELDCNIMLDDVSKVVNASKSSLSFQDFLNCKSDLYEVFMNSNKELEGYIGRSIDVWKFQ